MCFLGVIVLKKTIKQVLYCELCGAVVYRPRYYEVEGTTMILCENCAKYGKPVSPAVIRQEEKRIRERKERKSQFFTPDLSEQVLVEDYGRRIREARERLKLTQEDLARAIAEPVSYVRKIESQKVYPPDKVVEKLEKVLKIKLRETVITSDKYAPIDVKKDSTLEIKLGDILVIRRNKKKKKSH